MNLVSRLLIRPASSSFLLFIVLAACDSGPRPEPVVVYASPANEAQLTAIFADFTDDTGIPVTVSYEDSAVNTHRIIANEGSPPADILVTTNVADIWRAADEGALRPVLSERLDEAIAKFRDPDGYWIALDISESLIVYSDRIDSDPTASAPRSYADLAVPVLKGKVCLSSSALPGNRTLIAMLIDELGQREAELLVRGWIFNRATLPFDTDGDLLAAIDSGPCDYGIVSRNAAAGRERVLEPAVTYFDVHAMAVARHARYPESAQRLVDWVLANSELHDSEHLSDKNVAIAGWLAEDAERLAERASYR